MPVRIRSPPLQINNVTGVNLLEYRDCTDEINYAHANNLVWLILRNAFKEQRSIPAWSMFNEVSSISNTPLTTADMLSILQSHADDNNTITPVIHRFMALTKRLGQTNTIIFLDQPLYSRGKEIIWADSNKYKDVILMRDGLQISFKAIGQHMDSSCLNDLWVESGPTALMP